MEMYFSAVDDAGVDLVGENVEVVLDSEFGDAALDGVGVNGARRIARRVQVRIALVRGVILAAISSGSGWNWFRSASPNGDGRRRRSLR